MDSDEVEKVIAEAGEEIFDMDPQMGSNHLMT